jgi:hypothetical protein
MLDEQVVLKTRVLRKSSFSYAMLNSSTIGNGKILETFLHDRV